MGQASLPVDDARASPPVPPRISQGILLPEKASSLEAPPVPYFVTWRLARGREELDASERERVVAAMKSFEGQRYQLAAYVVMDDHVRALFTPFAGYELKAILHS